VLNFKENHSYTFRDLITVASDFSRISPFYGLKSVDARNVRIRVDEREDNEGRESIRGERGQHHILLHNI
jgi:hypothetical protein